MTEEKLTRLKFKLADLIKRISELLIREEDLTDLKPLAQNLTVNDREAVFKEFSELEVIPANFLLIDEELFGNTEIGRKFHM